MAESDDVNPIVSLLKERRDEVLAAWASTAVARLRGRLSEAEVLGEVSGLYDALVAGLAGGQLVPVTAPGLDELRAQLADLSRSRARQGLTPSETAVSVFALKDAVLAQLGERPEATAYADFIAFSTLVDELGLVTFEAYVEAREDVIANQTEELLELSTPVVKLWDGVLAVPLVGTLDSARTQVVMEKLLQTLLDTESDRAIIDITGVPAVDTQVAQHLLKTVVAARLMGTECVISGIRPQIAQTVVGLGIEFGDIVTKAKLSDAFKLTLAEIGLEVVPKRDAGA
ncbi:MAG TPA: STAS domain-containing protein [Acidimicrobiales bacterium]|jgi:rsbT co-antagonist protein RsbR|nr:STAS domain-containing protein [Acidimicrobiales bacterium]